jgi:Uma2 family endonuclease
MSESNGFSDRGQEPFANIPTDPDLFLEWSSRQPREAGRFELSNGRVIRTVINVTRRHSIICLNLAAELMRLLDRQKYVVSSVDFAVRTLTGIRGPDVMVDSEDLPGDALSTSSPIFIAEVLSPSTAVLDITTKQREYTAIPSLQTYLVCSQDEPRAWMWARKPDGSWPVDAEPVEGREASIPLGRLDIKLSMAAIFRGIPDAPTA